VGWAGYPTIYLGLSQRRDYLNAIKRANDENFSPIVTMFYSTYLDQHNEVPGQIMKNVTEKRTPGIDYLLKDFVRLKKECAKRNP
jgi:hypothetical protein